MELEVLLNPGTYVGLLSLIAMLLVLDIDNVVFLAIVSSGLPPEGQRKARNYGLIISIAVRGVLVFGISWLANLKDPLITVADFDLTFQDLIVLGGGLFLIYKSTTEIHDKLEGPDPTAKPQAANFARVLLSIFVLNLVFSVDSVITAVGMTKSLPLMLIAIAISLFIIFLFQGRIADFVQRHPTTKVLALSFLLLIGGFLVVEALHVHIPKGYIYFAMAFSLAVEILNINVRKRGKPVELHMVHAPDATDSNTKRKA